jgi:hypothetical protein
VEECFLDAEEVEGSIPSAPTIKRSLYSVKKVRKSLHAFHMNTYRFKWQYESMKEEISLLSVME